MNLKIMVMDYGKVRIEFDELVRYVELDREWAEKVGKHLVTASEVLAKKQDGQTPLIIPGRLLE